MRGQLSGGAFYCTLCYDSAESSSSESSSSSVPTVFNDENLDFLASHATFTEDADVSNTDSTVWTANTKFSSSDTKGITLFSKSLSNALQNKGYEQLTTTNYALVKDGFSYLVTITATPLTTTTMIVKITATKKESEL